MRILLIILVMMGCFLLAHAQEPRGLEKIVVRPSKNNYSMQTVSADELEKKNLWSLADVLEYAAGMDVRSRGRNGIQADLSLRGSAFEQVAVLIDGIRVMDPQTGHHNLDIPLTSMDIERVEVVKEGNSSFYGAGAFAGSVNIITRKPVQRKLAVKTTVGEHAFFGEEVSFSLPDLLISNRVSAERMQAKAGQPNTDFAYKTGSIYCAKDIVNSSWDALFGYQKKDFGADSFYSSLFPEEEEHTETFFWKTALDTRFDAAQWKNSLFLRKHRDKFILQRHSPTSVNYHTTYLYGLNSEYILPAACGELRAGFDAGKEQINSTNLGRHSRLHEAGFLGWTPALGSRFSADVRFRYDYYQKWRGQSSFNAGLGYYIVEDTVKLRSSLGRSFRLPSFTELYYVDAANKGNAQLGIERSDTLKVGVGVNKGRADAGLDWFLRKGSNLIDWTRMQPADNWAATNLGRVDFQGIEFNAKWDLGLQRGGLRFNDVLFSYTYLHADKKASGFFSKYALDILKHQYLCRGSAGVYGCDVDLQLSYNQRYHGETYFVGDLRVSRKIRLRGCLLEPFVAIENFSDSEYSEVSGVIQPGRWIKSGLKFQW